MLSDGYDISHLDLTLSRDRPCSSRSNKHYSVSHKKKKKSMPLSLLCLIGLRRNQIERDNCVPVTFPPRQADTVGRRAPSPPPRLPLPPEGRTNDACTMCARETSVCEAFRVCQRVSIRELLPPIFPPHGPIVHTGRFHAANLVFTSVVCFYLFCLLCRIWPDL